MQRKLQSTHRGSELVKLIANQGSKSSAFLAHKMPVGSMVCDLCCCQGHCVLAHGSSRMSGNKKISAMLAQRVVFPVNTFLQDDYIFSFEEPVPELDDSGQDGRSCTCSLPGLISSLNLNLH